MRDTTKCKKRKLLESELLESHTSEAMPSNEELLALAKELRSSAELPGWNDRDAMKAWLNNMLNRVGYADAIEAYVAAVHLPESERKAVARAKSPWLFTQEDHYDNPLRAAEESNIEPLREMYPHLEDYLNLPKRKRGQRYLMSNENLISAVSDVPRIRDLWKKHFGRVKRRCGELSAEEIAAKRWGVDEDAVFSAVKHRKSRRA